MVWVVKYTDINNGDGNITVWDNETAACKDVCACLVDEINNGWDFNNPNMLTIAQCIEKCIQTQQYREAVDYWNEWSDTSDIGVYWYVTDENLYTVSDAVNPSSIIWPTPSEDADAGLTTSPTVAIVAGATCRGCGNYNEYSVADQADETFVCYSCKTSGRT